jgi:hypothetical protein
LLTLVCGCLTDFVRGESRAELRRGWWVSNAEGHSGWGARVFGAGVGWSCLLSFAGYVWWWCCVDHKRDESRVSRLSWSVYGCVTGLVNGYSSLDCKGILHATGSEQASKDGQSCARRGSDALRKTPGSKLMYCSESVSRQLPIRLVQHTLT